MKYKVIDLFCGAGGLSAGLRKSGFDIKIGVDNNVQAIETYKINFKNATALLADIREINGYELLKLSKIKYGDNFLLAGCQPCQGFSNIGKREETDVKNQLVFEYMRIVKELNPTFILMENVPGMSKGVGKRIFAEAIKILEKEYYIEYDTLNAADFGVAQIRKRLVLHGIRKDVYSTIIQQKKLKEINILPKANYSKEIKKGYKRWKTVGDLISDLPPLLPGEEYKGNDIYNHVSRNISDLNKKRLDYIRKNGGTRTCLNKDLELKCHLKENVSYTDTYGILDLNKPAPTMTAGCTSISKGRFGHPTQNRGLSVREAARLQSFDDDFVFCGKIGSMTQQVGNAVPPKLAEASGKIILKYMKIYEKCIMI